MTIAFITLAITLGICGILMIKYLEGDFTIQEVEVIEKFTIDNINYIEHNVENLSKTTYVTQKITYDSNKVVYKTIHYLHN